jgi:hypothetical protein
MSAPYLGPYPNLTAIDKLAPLHSQLHSSTIMH